jgi:hypothetical protein
MTNGAPPLPPGLRTRKVFVECGCQGGGKHVNMHITEEGIAILKESGRPPDTTFETWWCRGCKSTRPIMLRHLYAS